MFRGIAVFVYVVVCYVAALATVAYLAAFLEDFAVPRSIDSAPQSQLWMALTVDLGLLVLLGGVDCHPNEVMPRWLSSFSGG